MPRVDLKDPWVFVWFFLCFFGAAALWPVVVSMGSLSCETGCQTATITMGLAYPILAFGWLIGLLIWSRKQPTRKVQITSAVLMPLAVMLAIFVSGALVILQGNLAN